MACPDVAHAAPGNNNTQRAAALGYANVTWQCVFYGTDPVHIRPAHIPTADGGSAGQPLAVEDTPPANRTPAAAPSKHCVTYQMRRPSKQKGRL